MTAQQFYDLLNDGERQAFALLSRRKLGLQLQQEQLLAKCTPLQCLMIAAALYPMLEKHRG